MLSVVNVELSEKYIELGVQPSKMFAVVNKQSIRQEIIDKYGELSDDGYYELTEDCGCGGTLRFDEVYETKPQVSTVADHFYYHYENKRYLLTTDEIFDFLDKNNIGLMIGVELDESGITEFNYLLTSPNPDDDFIMKDGFKTRFDATEAGFEAAIEFYKRNINKK